MIRFGEPFRRVHRRGAVSARLKARPSKADLGQQGLPNAHRSQERLAWLRSVGRVRAPAPTWTSWVRAPARTWASRAGTRPLAGSMGRNSLALGFGPPFLYDLARAAQRQRVSRDVFRNARSSSDVSILADCYGSDQGGVATYEYSVFDRSLVLVHAIVVAGDGACSNI